MMATYLGNGIISIKADVKDCVDFFENLNVSENTINKAILRKVGQGAVRETKRSYLTYLRRGSGDLYRSIKYTVTKDEVTVTNNAVSDKATAKDGRLARYGYMLGAGYTIKSKRDGGYLRFFRDGQWRRVPKVTVKPRPWVRTPSLRYVHSGSCEADIDKAFQQQLRKIEKKLGVYSD